MKQLSELSLADLTILSNLPIRRFISDKEFFEMKMKDRNELGTTRRNYIRQEIKNRISQINFNPK